MLKDDRIEVIVDGVFTVRELYRDEAGKVVDELKADETKGALEKAAGIDRVLFSEAVTGWKFEQECSEENKVAFQRQFPLKATEVLIDAKKKIEEVKEERLKNLFAGVSGS